MSKEQKEKRDRSPSPEERSDSHNSQDREKAQRLDAKAGEQKKSWAKVVAGLDIGGILLDQNDLFGILRTGGAYTPVLGSKYCSSGDSFKCSGSFDDDLNKLEVSMEQNGIQIWNKYDSTKKMRGRLQRTYIFNRGDRSHCTLISRRLALTKEYGNETYLLETENSFVVRVTNPRGNDIALAPYKSGIGEESAPYRFATVKPYDGESIDDYFLRALLLAERARSDVAGVLLQIASDKVISIPATSTKKNKQNLSGPAAMKAFVEGTLTDKKLISRTFEDIKSYVKKAISGSPYNPYSKEIKNIRILSLNDKPLATTRAKDLVSRILIENRLTPPSSLSKPAPPPPLTLSPTKIPSVQGARSLVDYKSPFLDTKSPPPSSCTRSKTILKEK